MRPVVLLPDKKIQSQLQGRVDLGLDKYFLNVACGRISLIEPEGIRDPKLDGYFTDIGVVRYQLCADESLVFGRGAFGLRFQLHGGTNIGVNERDNQEFLVAAGILRLRIS